MMNKQEFLTYAGLEMQTLDLWLEQRWLIPDQTFGGVNFFGCGCRAGASDPGSENWFRSQRRGHRRHPSSYGPAPRLCVAHSTNCTKISRNFAPGFNQAGEVASRINQEVAMIEKVAPLGQGELHALILQGFGAQAYWKGRVVAGRCTSLAVRCRERS
jgi:hypothetical protein